MRIMYVALKLLNTYIAVIAAIFNSIVPCSAQGNLDNIVVTNSAESYVSEYIGTRGTQDFDASRSYRIIMTPTIDASSPLGVRVPRNIREGVEELLVALPQQLLRLYKFSSITDQNGEPLIVCSTGNSEFDLSVSNWMQVYWGLRRTDSQLIMFFKNGISPKIDEISITSEITLRLCGRLSFDVKN